jgi:superfamily II DNA or RNA helicase
MAEPALALRYDRGTLVVDAHPGEALDPALVQALTAIEFTPDARIGQRLRAPARAYRAAVGVLVRHGVAVRDEARDYIELSLQLQRLREPWPHQQQAIDAWLRFGRRGVVVLPTGAGKSFVAELAMLQVQRSTLVVAPTIDLVTQWANLLAADLGIDGVGVVGGGSFEIRPVTVTTYDSAHIHVELLGNRFGFAIFDECHHLPGPSYRLAAEGLIAPFRLGLTATPERTDGGEALLGTLIGPTVHRVDIQDLRGVYLAPYQTVRIAATLSSDEVDAYQRARTTYRAFVDRHRIAMSRPDGWSRFLSLSARSRDGREALAAWREQRRIATQCSSKFSILESLLLQHKNDQVLIFTNDTDTVYRIARTWLIPPLTHETPASERRALLAAFNERRLKAIVTAKVLNEGVDLPGAEVGIVLAGSATVREHVQRLGRILRKSDDKEAVLYEVVTTGTGEESVSERRRDHGAYR